MVPFGLRLGGRGEEVVEEAALQRLRERENERRGERGEVATAHRANGRTERPTEGAEATGGDSERDGEAVCADGFEHRGDVAGEARRIGPIGGRERAR